MKLIPAVIVYAAVAASLVSALPGNASLYVDLKEEKYLAINDNMPFAFVTDGSDVVVVFETNLNRNPVSYSEKSGLIETSNLQPHWKRAYLDIYKDRFRKLRRDPKRYSIQPYLSVDKAAERYKDTGELPGDKTKVANLNYFKPDYSRDNLPQHQPHPGTASGERCPPGQQMYRTNGLFGIGARNLGCMTAYEAQSLRLQQQRNNQQNFQNNRPRNCTTNFIGGTAFTNCY